MVRRPLRAYVIGASCSRVHPQHDEPHGRDGEAEPLYQRALAIREKALGPEHPDVATSLENYADLLRKTGRVSEATKMEARAKAIGAKQASDN